jgi:1-acyl-sn-glycerol-3-phosphate acyltransferase
VQNVVIDKPYTFIPPDRGTFWARVLNGLFLRRYLRTRYGVSSYELVGVERLRASVTAGHGIVLAPNHCRPCDPMVLFPLGDAVGAPIHIMSSWHAFMEGRVQAWVLKHVGVFSVYREGLDREALKCAIEILTEGKRPLVLFPEGSVSRANDRLNHMMDGTIFIARNAAKQRAARATPGKVVVHPVAIRYFFCGEIGPAIGPVLEQIERRLSWHPQIGRPLTERIGRVAAALLTLKEIEFTGRPQEGSTPERIARLIDHLLVPLELQWLKGKRERETIGRIKSLRAAIVPDMAADRVDDTERARRWRQLADIYLAQQLANYPPEYVAGAATPERMLETVERFEEDLTDTVRVHGPLHAVVEVGEAIEVPPGRDRGAEGDPMMAEVRRSIEIMLERLRARRPVTPSNSA